jgi:SAM-dependent methyltransferase
LVLANGGHLPFANETFDAIYCGCVFPHVGVIGDSQTVAPGYRDARLALAREVTRVMKPSGAIFAASPNRLFPFDIFHGRKAGQYRPLRNDRKNPFLLSVADYTDLFLEAGCAYIRPLSIAGYWGFIRSRRSLKGYLLGLPVRAWFWAISTKAATPFYGSSLSPWIVVRARKHRE